MDFVHLVCVTSVNNNKYYDMRDCGDGTFEVTYGRIGATKNFAHYPISKWNSIYRQKLNKGYEDMTDMVATKEVVSVEKYKPIEDKKIASLIDFLRDKARETVKGNYTIGADSVSPYDDFFCTGYSEPSVGYGLLCWRIQRQAAGAVYGHSPSNDGCLLFPGI